MCASTHGGKAGAKPPLSGIQIVGDVIAGASTGAIGAFGLFMAGLALAGETDRRHPLEFGIGLLLFSIPVGFAVFCPVGPFFAARFSKQRVSFLATFGSGLLMAGMVIAGLAVPELVDSSVPGTIHLIILVVSPVVSLVGAVVGANRTRQKCAIGAHRLRRSRPTGRPGLHRHAD